MNKKYKPDMIFSYVMAVLGTMVLLGSIVATSVSCHFGEPVGIDPVGVSTHFVLLMMTVLAALKGAYYMELGYHNADLRNLQVPIGITGLLLGFAWEFNGGAWLTDGSIPMGVVCIVLGILYSAQGFYTIIKLLVGRHEWKTLLEGVCLLEGTKTEAITVLFRIEHLYYRYGWNAYKKWLPTVLSAWNKKDTPVYIGTGTVDLPPWTPLQPA